MSGVSKPSVRPEPIPYVGAECSPHRANVLRQIKKQDDLRDAGHKLWKQGDEEAAQVVYAESERAWDDAIHISNPADPDRSLCGHLGRNLVLLEGPRPCGWSGCWSCLRKADSVARSGGLTAGGGSHGSSPAVSRAADKEETT